jgi:type IV secretory pathway VirB10-like protein
MINPSRLFMLSGMLLALAACAPAVRQGPPAPIIGPGGSGAPAPAASGNVTVTPLKAPEITAVEQQPVQTFQRPDSAPAPTPEPAAASTPRDDDREQVALAKPRSMSKAVKTLVDQAELQRTSGDLTGAAATLERALRIEPDNAYVWNRLAHVRAAQGQGGLAGELAAKSNAFAGGDEALRRDNDRLIARSRK